jgi:hypothetical protein
MTTRSRAVRTGLPLASSERLGDRELTGDGDEPRRTAKYPLYAELAVMSRDLVVA